MCCAVSNISTGASALALGALVRFASLFGRPLSMLRRIVDGLAYAGALLLGASAAHGLLLPERLKPGDYGPAETVCLSTPPPLQLAGGYRWRCSKTQANS